MLEKTSNPTPLKIIAVIVAVVVTICVATAYASQTANPANRSVNESLPMLGGDEDADQIIYVEGELVVKLNGLDSISIDGINSQFGTEVKQYLPQLEIFLLATEEDADLDSLSEAIEALPTVLYSHPNYLVDPLQPVQGSFPFPDDDLVGSYPDQAAAITLDLSEAHELSTGNGVVVAVIDGGVDYNHPVFEGTVVSGYDYVDDDDDAFDEPGGDNSGHGTFVAGVVHLVAPEAEIRAYRVSEISGESDGYLVAEAILQAIEDGCWVINLSLVMMDEHNAIAEAIEYAKDKDVIIVAAAGNEQEQTPLYPSSDSNIIAVAAVDTLNLLADFSRYGEHIDVCAPGTDIYSPYQNNLYAWWSGTSFAAPFVSGQAALIISKAIQTFSWTWVKDAILNTAVDLDGLNPDFAGMLGRGLIDPVASLAISPPDSAHLTPDTLFFWSLGGYSAPQTGYSFLSSTNAPAAYQAFSDTDGFFFSLIDTAGQTNDSVGITVYPSGLSPGVYQSFALYSVDGVDNSPLLHIILTVENDTIPDSNMAWVVPISREFIIDEGAVGGDTSTLQIFSNNAPAPYTAELIGQPFFTTLITDSGFTNDSVYVIFEWDSLEVGIYCDTIVFNVEGVDNNPILFVATLTVQPEGGPDSAFLQPDTLFFWAEEGDSIPQVGYSFLTSTNAPAAYHAYRDTSAFFYSLIDTTGQTNDSVGVIVYPEDLGEGRYEGFVFYSVEGVVHSPFLVIILTVENDTIPEPDSAWVVPGSFELVVDEGTSGGDSVYLGIYSTNAPAPYTVELIGQPYFTTLIGDSGVTNDYVPVIFDWGGLGVGVYRDTLVFNVEGVVNNPVLFIATITVQPEGGPDSAFLYPDTLFFWAQEGDSIPQIGYSLLTSTNAPAVYHAYSDTDAFFFSLIDTIGQTNDSVGIIVYPEGLGQGVYQSFAMYFVDGVDNTAYLHIILTIVNDTIPGPDSAWVIPGFWELVVDEGTSGGDSVYLGIYSTNAPAPYTVELIGQPHFTTLIGDSGVTNDYVPVIFDWGGLGLGIYRDTLVFNVEGVVNSPILFIATITVQSGGGTDSAFFVPDTLFFSAHQGDEILLSGQSCLISTNAPASFFGWLADSIDCFVTMFDSAGYTNDSVTVQVSPSLVGPGVHYNRLLYNIDGIAEYAALTVCLIIYGSDSTSIVLSNYPNPFNPETNILFSIPKPSMVNLSVYNMLGQHVITLTNDRYAAGEHVVSWNGTSTSGRQVASGIYFYRIVTEESTACKKMLLLK